MTYMYKTISILLMNVHSASSGEDSGNRNVSRDESIDAREKHRNYDIEKYNEVVKYVTEGFPTLNSYW